jgi:hypothetical protein
MVSNGFAATTAERSAMMAASAQARQTGQPVVVGALTAETTQVVAEPRGGFTLSATTMPVRARAGSSWAPVDLRLHHDADGTYAPAATAYGSVTFSGGGTAPLAVTRSGATTYALTWPQALPTPTVTGSSATYPNALPGVDLVLSATASGGFSDVLVVKNAAAARNPALARINLAAKVTGGQPVPAAASQGTAIASAGHGMVLESATPLMWDSRSTDSFHIRQSARSAAQPVNPDSSSTAHPGAAARLAIVRASLTRSTLSLIPDHGLLASAATVYPVYIDPTNNWHNTDGGTPAFDETKQGAPCNGVSAYDNASAAEDSGQLGVGYMGFAGGCEGYMHSYYQWKLPTVLWGSDVHLATVNAKEVYSATCATTSYTVDLHQTGGIGSGTDWNNRPGFTKNGVHATQSFADACSSNPSNGFTVTSAIKAAASGHASSFTAVLTEDSYESVHNDVPFKRFADNPGLQIQYNLIPGTPAPSVLSAVTGSDNAGCATATPYPYIGKTILTNTPVLRAKISDGDGDKLQATFKYWIDGQTTTATGLSGDNLASGSTAAFSLPSAFVSALTNGQTVDWQVTQVSDGIDHSGASAVCHFTAEPNANLQPSVTSVNGVYPDIDNGGGAGAPAGTSGQFTLTNTGTTAATEFSYRIDVPPATVSPPSSEVAVASGNAATISLAPQSPGPHTLWVAAIDAAGDTSSMAAYRFEATGDTGTTCASLAACFDNTAISPDTALSQGAADGANSYSATDLANAGWASGGRVTVDGANFTLPGYGAAGQKDNVLVANQTISYSYPVPAAGSSALTFLASATNASTFSAPGAVSGTTAAPYVPAGTGVAGTYCFDSTDPSAYCPAQGTITYTDGTTQLYNLLVPDWATGPASLAAVVLPHENRPSGQVSTINPRIYPFSIPLVAGETVASVTLPDVSNQPQTQALHIFAMSTRNTTTGTIEANGSTAVAASGQAWTGAWANPTEGSYNFQGSNFSNQTFRIALKPSISGGAIRIKLDNALGTSKLVIGKATVALDAGSPSAVPSGAVHQLTFGGAAGVTVPEGGMAYSDPLTFAVTANQYLLVSFDITNSVAHLVEHGWANTAYTYLSAPGSGDHTADTAGTAFSGTGTYQGWFTDLLTDVDVTTNGIPTQAVLGDGLIDAWQPNTSPIGASPVRLSDDLAAAEPTTPSPYGTVAEGIESNQVMKDNPETYNGGSVGGPSALSRIDRDILDQPGLTTVVLYEGLEDVLNGQTSDNLDGNGYTALLNYLQNNNITVIVIGLTPCDGYTGDGATGNSVNDPCTAAVDSNRTTVNDWLSSGPDYMTPWSPTPLFYIDPDAAVGVTNTDGLQKLHPSAAISDNVNLTAAGTAALASGYLGPQNTWLLNDGPPANVALDTASNTTSPFVLNSAGIAEDATLSATGTTWTTDSTRGQVLTFDGASGNAATNGPVLTTNQSFSVSAWARLANSGSYHAIISQDATTASGFKLEFDYASGKWAFILPNADTTTPAQSTAYGTAATLGTWTHIVGVYNAATATASIYVNGTLAGTTSVPARSWTAAGSLTIGRTLWNGANSDLFDGDISDVQAWNYALAPNQVTALYQQIS